jgi:hypothetical protein
MAAFFRWISSRVYERSDASVVEGLRCACAAHHYGYDVHLCALPEKAKCVICEEDLFFYDEVVVVIEVIIRAVVPFSYLNFKYRGASAAGGGASYKAGYE